MDVFDIHTAEWIQTISLRKVANQDTARWNTPDQSGLNRLTSLTFVRLSDPTPER